MDTFKSMLRGLFAGQIAENNLRSELGNKFEAEHYNARTYGNEKMQEQLDRDQDKYVESHLPGLAKKHAEKEFEQEAENWFQEELTPDELALGGDYALRKWHSDHDDQIEFARGNSSGDATIKDIIGKIIGDEDFNRGLF